jgi:hypothetical protein
MTELSILGPADPLGHIVLLENHRDDGPVADFRESLSDGEAYVHEPVHLRSARSIVLSTRTHIPTGFGG